MSMIDFNGNFALTRNSSKYFINHLNNCNKKRKIEKLLLKYQIYGCFTLNIFVGEKWKETNYFHLRWQPFRESSICLKNFILLVLVFGIYVARYRLEGSNFLCEITEFWKKKVWNQWLLKLWNTGFQKFWLTGNPITKRKINMIGSKLFREKHFGV